jgi:TP901 family phage tail tape measure protein
MTELAKAGLSVEEAMAGAEGVLQLATAAQISNAEAAQIAANALNSFGLAGDQAARVADDLANAANAAQGSISDFGFAFAQSSAVARQVGLSLEDTTAILSLFAKNGLQGSDAGTSLRVALIRLVAPTQQAAAEIKKLGLNIRDAQGNVRADVFAQFGEATANLSPALRDASAALIFGQDAIRAVAIGAREGAEGLRIMQFEIDQQGTAAEVAAARTEGLAGSLSSLKSGAETLSISFGELISGRLKPLVDAISDDVVAINKLISKFKELEAAIPGSGGGSSPLSDFLSGLPEQATEIQRVLGGILQGKNLKFGTLEFAGAAKGARNLAKLNEELQALQTARTEAERGSAGPSPIADELTERIKALRAQIKELKNEGSGIDAGLTTPLHKALAELEKIRASRGPNVDTSGLDRLISRLREQIQVAGQATIKINDLPDGIVRVGDASNQAAQGVDALTRALRNLGQQAAQSQAELLRLQTEGGSPQQQIAVLQSSVQTQRDIIENIKSNGNQPGDASAIEKARNQIKSDQSQIESLQNEIASDAKALATAAEKAQKERQDAFERILAAQLRPKERLLLRAAQTEGLGDDIKFREVIIGILKGQIALIRKTLGNTKEARQLIKGIQDAILTEVIKLRTDRQNFRKQLHDALVERVERIQRGIELDIELADINENTKRRIALRQRLIAQLKREAKLLKLTGNQLKENRNEQARIRAEIDAINKESKDKGKGAAEFFFEQLQAQQGFASNLLGNLITGPTAGLVGVPAPPSTTGPGRGIATAQAQAEGKAGRGPTGGQQSATNDILQKILHQLRVLNGAHDAPEAINQKKSSGGSMDIAVM